MRNDKLISASALMLAVRDDPEINSRNFALMRRHINNASDEVKHGHWVIHIEKGRNAKSWAECSECHICGNPNWKVCPVCETRMDEEDNNVH